jgi:hypothetical protein
LQDGNLLLRFEFEANTLESRLALEKDDVVVLVAAFEKANRGIRIRNGLEPHRVAIERRRPVQIGDVEREIPEPLVTNHPFSFCHLTRYANYQFYMQLMMKGF